MPIPSARVPGTNVAEPSAPSGEARLRARIAAYSLHAQYDSRQLTAPARKAFLASFEDLVDPQRQLPPAERARRAEAARKAHFTRLALKSAQARRRKNSSKSESPKTGISGLSDVPPTDGVVDGKPTPS